MVNKIKNNVDGILLFNKTLGLSSNTAVQKVKRLYNASKVGHTGTLDPLATGLLPLCFGEATKFSSYLLDSDKEYIAEIQLGVTTTTYDSEGDIVAKLPVSVDVEQLHDVTKTFLGEITQTPPIYSALKVNGKALYKYARDGLDVEIKSRQIFIHELEILHYDVDLSQVKLRVLSSKGTYIRSLANDIGQKLGCGASLCGLMRTKTNEFMLSSAYTLDDLINMDRDAMNSILLPADVLVRQLPRMELTTNQMKELILGRVLSIGLVENIKNDTLLRLYIDDKFLGLGRYSDGKIVSYRLVNTQNFLMC